MLFRHDQSKVISGFSTTYFFLRKYKNNLKNRESQKKITNLSYICLCNMLLQNPLVSTRSEKRKSVFFKYILSLFSENTRPVPRDYVKSSQMRNKTPLQL